MHTRRGVSKKPVVQPVQTRRGKALERRSSATLTKGRTWPSPKQRLRRGGNPVASALYHRRANYRLSWKWSQGLLIAQECYGGAFGAAILSGFPTISDSVCFHIVLFPVRSLSGRKRSATQTNASGA